MINDCNHSSMYGLDTSRRIELIGDGAAFDIINAIRRLALIGSAATRSRIAEVTGFSIPTVTRTVSDDTKKDGLSYRELVTEDAEKKFVINGGFAYFLGIHIGIQKIRFAICDLSLNPITNDINKLNELGLVACLGKYFKKDHNLTSGYCCSLYNDSTNHKKKKSVTIYDVRERVNEIVNSVLDGFQKNNLPLVSICIASPAIYDLHTQEVKQCDGLECLQNAKLKTLLYQDTLERINGLNILLGFEHNTEASLIYEREQLYKEENKDSEPLVYNNIAEVYVGSGIGVAFIVNGQLFRGRLGTSGEVGHLRAPFLPDFDDLFSPEKLEKINDNEENLSLDDVKKCLKPYLTLDDAIRYQVFNCKPDDFETYLARVRSDFLSNGTNFRYKYPTRYKLLLQYISYITNVLIDLLSMDIIIYTGSIFLCIDGLFKDLINKQGEDALTCLANNTKGRQSSYFRENLDDLVAIGAAYAAFFRCDENNRKPDTINMPINVKWDSLRGKRSEK